MNIEYVPLTSIMKEGLLYSFFHSKKDNYLTELRNSIQLDGLLNPIIVTKIDDSYEVTDGKKRLDIIRQLSKSQPYKHRYSKVPCLVNDMEIQKQYTRPILLNDQELAHNIIRASYGSSSLSDISKRFECEMSITLQCLNLKNLNRKIFSLFFKGTLSLDQAYALSTSNDKSLQLKALYKLGPSASKNEFLEVISSNGPLPDYFNDNVNASIREHEKGLIAA